MVKRSVLTPVLSGVLAVTVAGSGALYFLDKKDSDDKAKNTDGSETSTVKRMFEKVEASADKVEKAIKGELDFAYNGKLELDFGAGFTKQAGVELKPIALEAKTKEKGGMSQADLIASYDGKTLATVNLVANNTEKVFYLKCPELNDAYLTGSTEELAKTIDEYKNNLGNSGFDFNAMSISSLSPNNLNVNGLREAMGDVDFSALADDLKDYIDVVKSKLPEGTEKGTVDGDIDGHSYSYTVKTIDVTGQVVVDVANAVIDKAKTDETLKKMITGSGSVSDEDYAQMLDKTKESLTKGASEDLSKSLFTFDAYYLGDDFRGFALDVEDKGTVKLVSIDDGTVFGIDLSANMGGSGDISLKGAFDTSNDELNGGFKLTAASEKTGDVSFAITAEKLKEEGDFFSGKLSAEFEAKDKSAAIVFESASTSESLDFTLSVDIDKEKFVTAKLTGKSTDASDIEVPTGTAIELNEDGLKQYLESCNTDAFMENIKNTLGPDVSDKIFNRGQDYDDDDLYQF